MDIMHKEGIYTIYIKKSDYINLNITDDIPLYDCVKNCSQSEIDMNWLSDVYLKSCKFDESMNCYVIIGERV